MQQVMPPGRAACNPAKRLLREPKRTVGKIGNHRLNYRVSPYNQDFGAKSAACRENPLEL